jgi:hypothetical protein
MNAPAKIPPADARYELIVKHHMPAALEHEVALRCSILRARDVAGSKIRNCSGEAFPVLDHMQRLVTHNAFRTMGIADLEALRACLLKMTMLANDLDRFAYETGGANASG